MTLATVRQLSIKSEAELEQLLSESPASIEEGLQLLERQVPAGRGFIDMLAVDADGTLAGYDLELTRTIAETVNVPIIASGGAGNCEHFAEVLTEGKADAALAASLFHDKQLTIGEVKRHLLALEIPIRPVGT